MDALDSYNTSYPAFFVQAEDGIRDLIVTGVQTCALPISFDFEGRQLSCEHGNRRVARYEYNGAVTVIADKFQGKRLNSPNDIAVHPDGGIWFTDPIYGIRGYYEGFKGESETNEAVYRVDGKTGQMEKVTDGLNEPNGICFSPDYKKVYICDTGTGREVRVYDIDNN